MLAVAVEGMKGHTIGVVGQFFIPVKDQVLLNFESQLPFTRQLQLAAAANLLDPGGNTVDVHLLRHLTLQAK